MSAQPSLLSVWNDIDAADEETFNAWYHEEHLGERLGLPGILTARRYAEIGVPRSYAAIYDTDGLAPLGSPAYLERLANPTPRTRAIMPRFRNMVRAASAVVFDLGDRGATPGPMLACIELGAGEVSAEALKALRDKGPGLIAAGTARRIRLASPDERATRVPNPEAKLREKPDALPSPFVLVEGDAEATLRAAVGTLGEALKALRPARFYALIEARAK